MDILKEARRTPRVPPAYGPANNQFRIRVNRGEGPNVASVAYALPHVRRRVLFLGVAERPDFIDLDALRWNVAKSDILILLARFADADKQAKDSALGDASETHCGAHRASLDQRRDDRNFPRRADYVRHDSTIRQRFRIVNGKVAKRAVLLPVLGLRPTCFGSFTGATSALLIGHGFKPALTADPAALCAHRAHDLLDNGELNGFGGFHENALRVLNGIKFWSSACPLWHTPKRCTDYRIGQEGSISNRPTTGET